MVLSLHEQLKEQGYAVVKNLVSEQDLAEVCAVTEGMIERWQAGEIQDEDFRCCESAEAQRSILYRIHNLEKKHPSINGVFELPAVMNLVQSVLGDGAAPTVCALIVKLPLFGGRVPYHCDPIDVDPGTVFNFSVFLDESTRENGCLEVVPGSHLLPPRVGFFDERPAGVEFVTAKRGDVVIHDVRIFHGSSTSCSPNLRRSICAEFQPAYMLNKTVLTAESLYSPAPAV